MMHYLSYTLASLIPVYGSVSRNLELRKLKSIAKGDSCQTYWFGMENHWGTHIDCPAHFFSNGAGVNDYAADFWKFSTPQILSLKAKPCQIILRKDFKQKINKKTDLLLIYSGWNKLRGTKEYSFSNPVIDPSVGLWLRKEFPLLRAIGFDWISASSYMRRDLGRQTHRVFLDPKGQGNPVLLIEDMYVPKSGSKLKEVLVLPLRIEGLDSSPCTIVGVFQ